ncbi:hypothetical protein A2130_00310 [Candidatus Woesebacteria bacterium GWC2_33_12]|uniref:Uncharacterized protein n=1 Tax=Candidatus Woesebacteria bacterium GW2011_GWB1_33_22 TaxID=1618566 RepID=A0A0F9ZKM0_9BACT|nr:MAG: hypothetical protein UR29_C0008G0011 [Candidatus Woesebacteria bacterium GW2011_GWC2_33_12]KKP42077.1 MAG: hypothetical protein UR33_C0006G0061 [Candidatus Woesebacteria bacterium GW2011_GWA2_33_20]KKP44773.1 MAG: hypothetical protein UR35_C0006G0008 [Candidatus Woesebacteria bacterium GW2011_GWB1_33_22]KKP46592.1 MAG: hypothetical protein UR37_C0006G0042 [Microgenomates group bacterium GW2011_GWC1_33_28]KKP50505.1 MAG: hypothetical protein UR41_C0006G0008 [Candidatus Woesebacteria bact
MNNDKIEPVSKLDKKESRLGVNWRNKWINFCSVNFTEDGSFIFSSKFHNNKEPIEVGTSRLVGQTLVNHKKEQNHIISNGCHISLHPEKQVMHFRENFPGKILYTRKFHWYPVDTPFNLLYLYSPPLDTCLADKKKCPFFTPIQDNYTSSIQLKIDLFPRDTQEHFPQKNSVWIFWGYCPRYLVRISFNLINQRVPALIYWPEDSELKL